MTNTRSATLSIRLKPETKRRLAKLAEASGRSSNFLVSDAVESYVADQERMLAEIRQADRQVKSGHYIRHEDMKAWLLSWGTDRELPPPKCVSGKDHDDEGAVPVESAWSPFARARLQKIRAYMALDKPDAAVVEALRNHPYLGRAGNSRVYRGHPLHRSLPRARQAHHHQHHLACVTKKVSKLDA